MRKRTAAAIGAGFYVGLVIVTSPAVAGVRLLLVRSDLPDLAARTADSTIEHFEALAQELWGDK